MRRALLIAMMRAAERRAPPVVPQLPSAPGLAVDATLYTTPSFAGLGDSDAPETMQLNADVIIIMMHLPTVQKVCCVPVRHVGQWVSTHWQWVGIPLDPACLPCEEARRVIRCLLETLVGAHSLGVLHREIRWPNIVLLFTGEYQLIDWEYSAKPGEVLWLHGHGRRHSETDDVLIVAKLVAEVPNAEPSGEAFARLLRSRVTWIAAAALQAMEETWPEEGASMTPVGVAEEERSDALQATSAAPSAAFSSVARGPAPAESESEEQPSEGRERRAAVVAAALIAKRQRR